MPERYLLLEQPRGRERSIRLSLTSARTAGVWDVKRTTLHGVNKGTASETLERGAELAVAEARFDFFCRSYLERGWYPPACEQLEKRDLITRFVGRWPALPHVLAYDPDNVAADVADTAGIAGLRLRIYRRGERTLLRVAADGALVLSDVNGLRRPVPDWLPIALAGLPSSMLPAIFEARLYTDSIALSDLIHAQRDLRAVPFAERWEALWTALAPLKQHLAAHQVGFDAPIAVNDLPDQLRKAMSQGYEEAVIQDPSQAYHYGEAPDAGGFMAWERVD